MTNSLKPILSMTMLLGCTLVPASSMADEMPLPGPAAPAASRAAIGREVTAIGVMLDFAKLISFEQAARTIIIGNPAIVDGTLSDEHTIVLTGKGVGTTNMIVLGEEGQQIANFAVHVSGNASQVTTVHQGVVQQIYSCAGPCRPLTAPAASTK